MHSRSLQLFPLFGPSPTACTLANQSLDILGLKFDHSRILESGVLIVEVVQVNGGEIETGRDVLRVQFDGFCEVEHRLWLFVLSQVRQAQVGQCLSTVGVDPEHFLLEEPPGNR